MPSKDEQVQALLTGKGYELATKTLGVSHMARRSYSEVFTVTRADIDDYTRQHGIPMDRVITDGSAKEGIHFVRTDSGWELYWWERGCVFDHQTFAEEASARRCLIDLLLGCSGTGLKFA